MLRRLCLLLLLAAGAPAFACGSDSDCMVGDRSYRIALPDVQDDGKPLGAVIFAHGYRGTAAGVMKNGSMRGMILGQGLAFIAVQGVDGTWDLPYGPGSYDSTGAAEFAYFDAVVADVAERLGIDPARIVVSGFSAGGMMVWNLACSHPARFAGFVPMSGTFWLKPPETCEKPVSSVVHIHGDADTTVPLTGRPIGETTQGKVAEALDMYEVFGDFGPATTEKSGDLDCIHRTNAEGNILDFCIFPGGHSFRTEHLQFAIKQLRAAGEI